MIEGHWQSQHTYCALQCIQFGQLKDNKAGLDCVVVSENGFQVMPRPEKCLQREKAT